VTQFGFPEEIAADQVPYDDFQVGINTINRDWITFFIIFVYSSSLPFSAYYLASSGHPILAPFYYLASFVSVITINVAEQKDVDQKITQPSKLGAKNSKYR